MSFVSVLLGSKGVHYPFGCDLAIILIKQIIKTAIGAIIVRIENNIIHLPMGGREGVVLIIIHNELFEGILNQSKSLVFCTPNS